MSWCPRPLVLLYLSIRPHAPTEMTLRDVEAAARAIGLQLQVLNASTSREIDAAFASIVRERPDALFVAAAPFLIESARPIGPIWRRATHPCDISRSRVIRRSRRVDELRSQPDGRLSSDRHLRRPHPQGAKPHGIAGATVEQIQLVINVPTARMLGLIVPQSCSPAPTR